MGLWGSMIKKQIKEQIVKSGTYKALEREKNIIKDVKFGTKIRFHMMIMLSGTNRLFGL